MFYKSLRNKLQAKIMVFTILRGTEDRKSGEYTYNYNICHICQTYRQTDFPGIKVEG